VRKGYTPKEVHDLMQPLGTGCGSNRSGHGMFDLFIEDYTDEADIIEPLGHEKKGSGLHRGSNPAHRTSRKRQ